VFLGVFISVSDVCCKCFNCFERVLQMFHLDVSIDWVLHLPPRLLLLASVSPPFLDAGDVRAVWAHVGVDGMGGASHSSDAESEGAGRAARSKRGARGAASGRGPRAGRPSASLTVISFYC
jgi:hypothetical protein